jgi:Exonuclease I
MSKTFFFYDLETSGLNPRQDRIMQFAGQRTDMDLNPIGESVNVLVRLGDDVLPSPYALMVTGITPQKTLDEGYSEAEFARMMVEDFFTPETIAIGYNSVRFDDEFVRYHLWRNFFDPYEWTWSEGRSRWDLLDVVRMTRALRPEGIKWPFDSGGKPTNRLELLTKENGISHEAAHDAMSDVDALIDVARLIKDKQPRLFEHLLKVRGKNEVKSLVNLDEKKEFVYSSGRYDNEFNKTTIAFPLTAGRNGNVIVYDLRYDPDEFIAMTKDELKKSIFARWEDRQKEGFQKVPVKEMQYNHCPAVAPVVVLEQGDGWNKISLDKNNVIDNKNKLLSAPEFAEKIRDIIEGRPDFESDSDPEGRLYDGFLDGPDKKKVEVVRNASEDKLADLHPEFIDERLPELLLHYKARNYPKSLSSDEAMKWELWRESRIQNQMPAYAKILEELTKTAGNDKQFIVQELQLWLENVVPADW